MIVVVVKSNKYYIFWVWGFRFTYPACKEHAPYCHLWSFQLYCTFPHYLINSTTFGGRREVIEHETVFWLCLQVLSETFLILRRNERDITINVYTSSYKVPLFLSDFNGTWVSLIDFGKITLISKLAKMSPLEAELFHTDGWTYRQTWRS